MTNKDFLKLKNPWPEDSQELVAYINNVMHEYNTSYNDAPYGPALAAIAAFNYTASQMGLSGYQASWAEMLILMKLRNMEQGFKILDYKNLLYPQYLHDFDINAETLIRENLESLKKEAKKLLDENVSAAQEVRDHWIYITEIPDSEEIKED